MSIKQKMGAIMMELKQNGAEIYVPDNKDTTEALSRTTHMAISAHQDDIEIMAYDGILECFGKQDKWFTGIVVTNGSGSARTGLYADYSDEQMQEIRRIEQKKAAYIGEYSAQLLMNYPSSAVKNHNNVDVIEDILSIIKMSHPKIIYTHNLADKHDTHVGTALKVISALRELPKDYHPEKVYGCEVWRDLDWVNDSEKVSFDVSSNSSLAAALLGVFDSQISGGKRYDLATQGRRIATATYAESHETDTSSALIYAMDLTPLIRDVSLDINEYVQGYIKRFSDDVSEKILRLSK